MNEEDLKEQTRLWDAINEYTRACGGDTGRKTVGIRRMNAVVTVSQTVQSVRKREQYRCHRIVANRLAALTPAGITEVPPIVVELRNILAMITESD